MTRDTAARAPRPTHRVALMAVSTLLVAGATACGTDSGAESGGATAADDSTTSATTSGAATGSAEPTSSGSGSPTADATASASTSGTPVGDPVPSPVVNKAVQAALAAGFPALVPAGVPAGWTVDSAAYSEKRGGTWRIALTEPGGGSVRLVQTGQALDDLIGAELGVEVQEAGSVDLGSSGTGRWKVYTGGEAAGLLTAIAARIAGTSAVVSGPDKDTVVELAEQLLTAEDAGGGGGGYE